MIVVDVNVIAFYLIEGNRTSDAQTLKRLDPMWVVPPFWAIEFQSILWKYVRFGGMPVTDAQRILTHALSMFAPNETNTFPENTFLSAVKRKITVYDAQYVSLAEQYDVLCISEDVALQKACPERVYSLTSFIDQFSGGLNLREKAATYSTIRRKKTLPVSNA